MTHHHSHSLSLVLPTPEILGSVAGGAHYAGALSPHDKHVHPSHIEKHKRSFSLSADDPMLEEAYRGVMQDLQEVRTCFTKTPIIAHSVVVASDPAAFLWPAYARNISTEVATRCAL